MQQLKFSKNPITPCQQAFQQAFQHSLPTGLPAPSNHKLRSLASLHYCLSLLAAIYSVWPLTSDKVLTWLCIQLNP
jgi:hypothetical protein